MNYIALINNVWNMREQGIITHHEQDLYLYLLHKSNTLYWKNPVNHRSTIICSILGINKSMLSRRRKRLKQLGLIDYKEGTTMTKPPLYFITDLFPSSTVPQQVQESEKSNRKASHGKEKAAPRFTPPTPAEVQAYCNERGNGIDADHFVDFYTSKGWMLGRNKMKDWKAAIRTWEQTEKNSNNNATNRNHQKIRTDERF